MLSRTYWLGILVAVVIVASALTGLGILESAILVGVAGLLVFLPVRSVLPETRRLADATGTRRWIWLVGIALGAAGIGLVHVIGDPTYHVECAIRSTRRCATAHNWATIVYLTGIMSGVIAASVYPAYRLVWRGSETSAATASPGHVVVSGKVVPHEETLETPFTGTETVCYRYAVQERHNASLFADGGSWHTVAVGERAVPFYVEDESGRLLVDPDDAILTLNEMSAFGPVGEVTRADVSAGGDSASVDAESTGSAEDDEVLEALVTSGRVYQVDAEVTVAADTSPPDRIADWERDRGGVFPLVSRDKRYTEDHLRPGDRVTIAGKLQSFDYGYPERYVLGGDGAPVKISAGEQQHVTSHLTGAVWIGGAIAALLVPLGLGAMVLTS